MATKISEMSAATTLTLNDEVPIVQYPGGTATNKKTTLGKLGAVVGRGILHGLRTAQTATYKANIQAGAAYDASGAAVIELTAAIEKDLANSWVVGDGNGGLDTGSKATNTWYYFWLIRRSDTGVVDALFSLSPTAPTMPANYDQKCRVGQIHTESLVTGIRPYVQRGDLFLWDEPLSDWQGTFTATPASTTVSFPALPVEGLLQVSVQLAGATRALRIWSPLTTDAPPGGTSYNSTPNGCPRLTSADQGVNVAQLLIITENSQVRHATSSGNWDGAMWALQYRDLTLWGRG